MKIIHTIKSMFAAAKKAKAKGRTIGLVPTMGALHEGHLSLIRRARRENDLVVVSIFVNPAQFGPCEDFKKYPRNLKLDAELCKKEAVDIIFNPDAKEIYPEGYRTYVTVEGLSDCLCGKSRPAHFKGVATIVTKLFNIVNPDAAYFGQKDAQQAIIIKKLVSDLNLPVKIKTLPIVREKDGLAMSSRNVHLNEKEKKDAVILFESLKYARDLIKDGITDPGRVIGEIRRLVNKKDKAKIDYVSVVGPHDLIPVDKIKGNCLIALAVWFGRTRLIDNMIIKSRNS